jgi:hypothetical protein
MEKETEELREFSEITYFNATSPSFEFLKDEPDLYSIADLKVVYHKPVD